ncbi:DHH family phosphoesterase [Desulfolithobacter dissulfuricans]|uniref:DHH family phosphoesterase n=1 Tax=Desulfolithobacter dissulfuricans TaxID=2795293 RepID=A0A915UAT2_9BACT|nr:DHH family phosphoesterase [Desulfolithobacter dissulfuricans]BCO09920.1 DHH family phosphoesterase [Desulfolithobacter dissulfuricans]
MQQKRLEKIADTITRSASRNSARDRLNGLWELFDRDDEVLIVISADPDALASAMAMKRLLSYRVGSVTIGYPNEIRRLNNLTMVERLKIPIERLHTLPVKDYSKRILIDSQPTHQPCFEKLEFDAVIDHHPVTEGWDAKFIDIRPEYGAVSTMMVEYLRAAGIKPSVALATALFYGIKVDTQNFEKSSLLADGIAFRYVFKFANRNLVRKFELTELRRSELKYFKIALNELKVSKGRAYIHLGRVGTPDIQVIIADFFNRVDKIDWVLVSGIHGEKLIVIFRCDGYRKNAGKLAQKTFGEFGSAGGHKEAARAEVPLKNLPLRENHEFSTHTLMRLATRHMR